MLKRQPGTLNENENTVNNMRELRGFYNGGSLIINPWLVDP